MPVSIFGSINYTGVERKLSVSVATEPVNAPINMNGKPIVNLPSPDEQTNAASKQYVNDKLDNLDVKLKQYINDVIKKEVVESLHANKITTI